MGKKILVIDDEPDIVEFQKSYLSRKGHQVFTAASTPEAIEAIKKESPDVVFCDLRLENDTSGLDILEQAKKIKPDITVYLISGFTNGATQERGLALGAKEILPKPLPNADLERKVQEA